MADRASNPEPGIVDKVLADKQAEWSEETRKRAQTDAQHVLEALVTFCGVEGTVRALIGQGFDGDAMRYLLKPLYQEAVRRRRIVQPTWFDVEDDPERPLTDEEFEALADQLVEEGTAACERAGSSGKDLPITREEIYQDHL